MATGNKNCPTTGCGEEDVVRGVFSRVGVTRSAMVTLALVPFSWDGVLWFRDAISWVWTGVTTWGQ